MHRIINGITRTHGLQLGFHPQTRDKGRTTMPSIVNNTMKKTWYQTISSLNVRTAMHTIINPEHSQKVLLNNFGNSKARTALHRTFNSKMLYCFFQNVQGSTHRIKSRTTINLNVCLWKEIRYISWNFQPLSLSEVLQVNSLKATPF